MKIAFVSDDHSTISLHFGRALFYEVVSIEEGSVVKSETRNKSNPQWIASLNDTTLNNDLHHQHDHSAMIIPIEDCEVLISRGMGRAAHVSLQEHDIQPIITEIVEIVIAIQAFIDGTIQDHPEKLH